ncbi:MAG TPA: helix-turn-helix domain-containing protein [Candidatus Acidoferrum sp.]|nr:helix-turn-helix domain-containing protein [Candidatus Acidoferrum sp.]
MPQPNTTAPRTQSIILDAAEHQFARFGYHKVTMEEIALDAGLKKASLYYYFPTKDELLEAVVGRKRDEFRQKVDKLLGQEAPSHERIKAYARIRLEYFDELIALRMYESRPIARNRPVLKEMFLHHSQQELEWLTRLFLDGGRNGEFEVRSAGRVAALYLHIMQGLRLRYMRTLEDNGFDPEVAAQSRREFGAVTEIFLKGIEIRTAGGGERNGPAAK